MIDTAKIHFVSLWPRRMDGIVSDVFDYFENVFFKLFSNFTWKHFRKRKHPTKIVPLFFEKNSRSK